MLPVVLYEADGAIVVVALVGIGGGGCCGGGDVG